MTTVVGLDVSKASVTVCVLKERPADVREAFYDQDFLTLPANAEGLRQLLAIAPTVAVMEPTGVNYSRLWGTHLARAGVPVWLVGHTQLHGYRKTHLDLPDKDDDADALALACYWWDYHQDSRRFVQQRDPTIARIRELVLRLAHLARVQSPVINRLRQDLAWQVPEIALCQSKRRADGTYPLWSVLAGDETRPKIAKTIAQTVGTGLQPPAIAAARRLNDIGREEVLYERELAKLMSRPEFTPYRRVFARFGFGQRVQAILLSQIFPFEGFLGPDGRAIVKVRKGRESKKPSKKRISERRFRKALGMAPEKKESGDKSQTKLVGGSDLCRKTLWQWVFTCIEVTKSRPRNAIGDRLGQELDELKASGHPVKKARMKVAGRAVNLLFNELLRVVADGGATEEE